MDIAFGSAVTPRGRFGAAGYSRFDNMTDVIRVSTYVMAQPAFGLLLLA